jgi:hypothetical protein
VLANIVSLLALLRISEFSHFTDGRQGRHVDIKGRMGGARVARTGEVGRKRMITRNIPLRRNYNTIDLKHTQSVAPRHSRTPRCVSFSQVVSSVARCRGTMTGGRTQRMRKHTMERRAAPVCFLSSTMSLATLAARLLWTLSRAGDRRALCNIAILLALNTYHVPLFLVRPETITLILYEAAALSWDCV